MKCGFLPVIHRENMVSVVRLWQTLRDFSMGGQRFGADPTWSVDLAC